MPRWMPDASTSQFPGRSSSAEMPPAMNPSRIASRLMTVTAAQRAGPVRRAASSSPTIASSAAPSASHARPGADGSSIAIQCSEPNAASSMKVTPRA
jgi:hypothetical protein